MVILAVFNSFNVVKNLKKPNLGRVKSPHFTLLTGVDVASRYKVVRALKTNKGGQVALVLEAQYSKDGLLK